MHAQQDRGLSDTALILPTSTPSASSSWCALVFALMTPQLFCIGLHGAGMERLRVSDDSLLPLFIVGGVFGAALPGLANHARKVRFMGWSVAVGVLPMLYTVGSSGPWTPNCGPTSWEGVDLLLRRGASVGAALGFLLALFIRNLAELILVGGADARDRISLRLSLALGTVSALFATCTLTSQARVVAVVMSLLSLLSILGILARDVARLRQIARLHAGRAPDLRLVPFEVAFGDLPRVVGATVGTLGVVRRTSGGVYRQLARRAIACSDPGAVAFLRRRAVRHGASPLLVLGVLTVLVAGGRLGVNGVSLGDELRFAGATSCCL